MVATLLRTNIRIILILYIRLIFANKGRRMTVDIILLRTTAIIFQLREWCRQIQYHTISEQVSYLSRFIRGHLLGNRNLTFRIDAITKYQLSLHLRHFKGSRQDNTILHLTLIKWLQVHYRIFPNLQLLLQRSTIIIISRSTPEFRLHALAEFQDRFAIYVKIINHTRLLAYGNRHSLGRNLHIAIGFLYLDATVILEFPFLTRNLSRSRCNRSIYLIKLIFIDDKLLAGHHLSLLYQWFCTIAGKGKIDCNFLLTMFRLCFSNSILQSITLHHFSCLRSNTLSLRNLNSR